MDGKKIKQWLTKVPYKRTYNHVDRQKKIYGEKNKSGQLGMCSSMRESFRFSGAAAVIGGAKLFFYVCSFTLRVHCEESSNYFPVIVRFVHTLSSCSFRH